MRLSLFYQVKIMGLNAREAPERTARLLERLYPSKVPTALVPIGPLLVSNRRRVLASGRFASFVTASYTGCVTLSSGWFFLIGGATGAVRVAIAKRFFESDFANSEGVITDEQRKTPVHITPVQRWLIVLACIGVAIIGCFLIQHDGNWNPFPHLRD